MYNRFQALRRVTSIRDYPCNRLTILARHSLWYTFVCPFSSLCQIPSFFLPTSRGSPQRAQGRYSSVSTTSRTCTIVDSPMVTAIPTTSAGNLSPFGPVGMIIQHYLQIDYPNTRKTAGQPHNLMSDRSIQGPCPSISHTASPVLLLTLQVYFGRLTLIRIAHRDAFPDQILPYTSHPNALTFQRLPV